MTGHLAATPDRSQSARRSSAPAPAGRRLCFGDFELIASSGELFRRGPDSTSRPVRLQPQPSRVLRYLAERPGRLVTRGELQQLLWGDDYFVDCEQGLNYCIREVRRTLGDRAADPVFLETVPRRGYRFLSRVEVRARPARLLRHGSAPTVTARGREPVASYPKLGKRHVLLIGLTVAAFTAIGTVGVMRGVTENGWWLRLLLPLCGALYLPYVVLTGLASPKVRIGPDWIESYDDRYGERRREQLGELVGVVSEDDRSICFELVDGRELWIRRKHVGRYDWPGVRAELAYRLDFYPADEALPTPTVVSDQS